MEWLQVTWFALIVLLLCGYSILDGFDLGVGVLTPYLARNKEEKARLFSAVGPFWDGNEVWLLAGGGALFAAFPPVYATVFSGFYLALMLVLFALIFRAVSLEFWSHSENHGKVWSHAFTFGSLVPAILFGVTLGNILQGVPLDAHSDFAGNFFTLLRPFPLALGLYGLSVFVLHGAVYAGMKTDGAVRGRAGKIVTPLALLSLTLLIVMVVLAAGVLPFAVSRISVWLWLAGTAGLIVLAMVWGRQGRMGKAFLATSISFVTSWLAAAVVQFPILLRSDDGIRHLTIQNASSGALTLKVMLVIALAGIPVVVGYTIYVYRVFARGPEK